MATAQRLQTVVINLELTIQEAVWLKNAIQNPMYGTRPENEDPQQRKIREAIFNALNEQKI